MDRSSTASGRNVDMEHRIETRRFILRTLAPQDATQRYVDWFSDPSIVRYIQSAAQPQSLATLRSYIEDKAASPTAELFGIFLRQGGLHLGNIKFEPIDDELRAAIVGVMVGDRDWRGKGTFHEAFLAVSDFLYQSRGIVHFWLGVESDHHAALAGYRKAGFVAAVPPIQLIPVTRPDSVYLVCSKK